MSWGYPRYSNVHSIYPATQMRRSFAGFPNIPRYPLPVNQPIPVPYGVGRMWAAPPMGMAAPQYGAVPPQYSAAAPQYSAAAPQYSAAAPQYSAAAPPYNAPSFFYGKKKKKRKNRKRNPALEEVEFQSAPPTRAKKKRRKRRVRGPGFIAQGAVPTAIPMGYRRPVPIGPGFFPPVRPFPRPFANGYGMSPRVPVLPSWAQYYEEYESSDSDYESEDDYDYDYDEPVYRNRVIPALNPERMARFHRNVDSEHPYRWEPRDDWEGTTPHAGSQSVQQPTQGTYPTQKQRQETAGSQNSRKANSITDKMKKK